MAQADTAALRQSLTEQLQKAANHQLAAQEREEAWRLAGALANTMAEQSFESGSYERATALFVEADQYLRQYHKSYFLRQQQELAEAERKHAAYASEPNLEKRNALLHTSRILIGAYLSELIREAGHLDDQVGRKQYLERLAALSEEGGDTKGRAEAYEKLGELELQNGNSDAAFRFYQQALALRKKLGNEYRSIDYLAHAHWQNGDYTTASANFDEEIRLVAHLLSRPVDTTMNLPPHLGWSEKDLADLRHRQRLIAQMERITLRSSIASALFNQIQIRLAQGRYGAASELLNRVQLQIDTLSDRWQPGDELVESLTALTIRTHQANAFRIRGRIAEAKGDDAAAVAHYQKALSDFTQLAAGEPSGALAGLRNRLALLYARQGRWAEARAQIRESLRLRARLHQERGTVYALITAGRIEALAGERAAAMKLMRQAKGAALNLTQGEDLLAEAGEAEADLLVDGAPGPSALTLESAIVAYKTAVEAYRRAELRPLLVRALTSLGKTQERAGDLRDAEQAYRQAVSVRQSISSDFGKREEASLFQQAGEGREAYQRLVDLLIRQGKHEEALGFASQWQREGLLERVPKSDIRLSGKSGAALNDVARAGQRLQEVRAGSEQARAEGKMPGNRGSGASALGIARQEYALAIKRLEEEQPNLRFTVRPTDLLKLQSGLGVHEALLSYLCTPGQLYIFAIRHNRVAVRTVPVGESELLETVALARESIAAFSKQFYARSENTDAAFDIEKKRPDLRRTDSSGNGRDEAVQTLTRLYTQLIGPASDLLAGVQTLKLIPNGPLFLLPFSALVDPKTDRYLIEQHALVFFTAGDLIPGASRPAAGDLVAFGNPTEAGLDGALEEVRSIRKVLPATRLFTGDAASKSRLFRTSKPRILHLATHGHIRTPLEQSHIQLARLPGLEDPDLSYGEIFALPFESLDLVVLSACKTALGTVNGTDIGVFIEAFRTKARTVAASLWSVDDLATRNLMIRFYSELKVGRSRADALRKAQLHLLRDPRTKHPFFWASFVLYGDGSRLPGLK